MFVWFIFEYISSLYFHYTSMVDWKCHISKHIYIYKDMLLYIFITILLTFYFPCQLCLVHAIYLNTDIDRHSSILCPLNTTTFILCYLSLKSENKCIYEYKLIIIMLGTYVHEKEDQFLSVRLFICCLSSTCILMWITNCFDCNNEKMDNCK